MATNRNRLTRAAVVTPARDKCKRCGGSGQIDMADCDDCAGDGIEPTIPELRAQLGALEAIAVARREAGGSAGAELAAKLGNKRAQLRAAERAANGDK